MQLGPALGRAPHRASSIRDLTGHPRARDDPVMPEAKDCLLCRRTDPTVSYGHPRSLVDCRTCGRYEVTDQDRELWPPDDRDRPLLSALVRRHNTATGRPYTLKDRPAGGKFPSGLVHPPVASKTDRVLLLLADMSARFGALLSVQVDDAWPLAQTNGKEEFIAILDYLTTRGFLLRGSASHVKGEPFQATVTGDGWNEVHRLRPGGRDTLQVFVAMWFDATMTEAFDKGVLLAAQDAGYNALRVDRREYVGKIDDFVMLQIQRSRIVVVDCTGHRNNVYFEAGYAMGLGIPVVWSCRDDEISKAPFDTRQFNTIVWKDVAELRERLANRIKILFPRDAR